MSVLSSASLRVTLSATATSERTNVSGPQSLGTSIIKRLSDASIGWAATLTFGGSSAVAEASFGIGFIDVGIGSTPVHQVETATVVAASGCTSNGTCNVVVTGAGIAGSPVTVPVALTTATHTSAALIAAAIRTELAATAAITARYTPGGSSATATLTDKLYRNSDATLNIAIPSGLGITVAATSANTTAGVGGVIITGGGDGNDDDGQQLAAATLLQAVVIENTGAADIELTGAAVEGAGSGKLLIKAGTFIALGIDDGTTIDDRWLGAADVILTATGVTTATVTAYAAP